MAEISVTGLAELQKILDQLPAKMEANVLRGALRAGAKVQLAAAKAQVPVKSGALRDSLKISTRTRRGTVKAVLSAGAKNKKTGGDAFYARFVEFGTAQHFIKPKKAKSLFFAGLFGEVVDHPGSKKHPFMRPALDASAQAATQAVGQYIRQRLERQGLIDAPGPENT